MKLIIGGDIYPGAEPPGNFQQPEGLLGYLSSLIKGCDVFVANLETPLLCKALPPTRKVGPALQVMPAWANALAHSGLTAVSLANNHILDYGSEGLLSTLAACRSAGLGVFGAGSTETEAELPLVLNIGGSVVGFIGAAENEFCTRSKENKSIMSLDPIRLYRATQRARERVDFLVVLVHGGREYYPYPTPRLQELCCFLTEVGAGLVVCQHTHCVGCHQSQHGKLVLYGQGDLIFEQNMTPWSNREAVLLEVEIEGSLLRSFKLYPFAVGSGRQGPQILDPCREGDFLNALAKRCNEISQSGFVEERWKQYASETGEKALTLLRQHRRWLRGLARIIDVDSILFNQDWRLRLLHALKCESHRLLLDEVLQSHLDGRVVNGN
jgi:poly-gamma-glutamate capsule biosynthesis protein CapA/YwtB (metallophosphatase superfamily)